MPLGKNVRYRFKGSGKRRVRLAFKGNKVVERTPWPEGGKKGKSKRIHIPGGSTHELVEMGPETESKVYECPPEHSMAKAVRELAGMAGQDTHEGSFSKRPGKDGSSEDY